MQSPKINFSKGSDNSNKKSTKVFLTGDVMLGRTVMIKSFEENDSQYPFRKATWRFKEGDIVFINLENPVISNCPLSSGGMIFCTRPEMLGGLKLIGVDVVSLANNHARNYGEKGLNETVNFLKERGIEAVGLGNLVEKQIANTSFGFLGFDKSQIINPKLSQEEIDLIRNSDAKVDVLIISMHWGIEYRDNPLHGVRSLANELVNYGADIVVGHHPHWVQGVECLEQIAPGTWNSSVPKEGSCPSGSKQIFYSLGNFVFDQMWSEKTREGNVIELEFKGGEIKNWKIHKTYMRNLAQPEFVD